MYACSGLNFSEVGKDGEGLLERVFLLSFKK